jgi:hypothetical protein
VLLRSCVAAIRRVLVARDGESGANPTELCKRSLVLRKALVSRFGPRPPFHASAEVRLGS